MHLPRSRAVVAVLGLGLITALAGCGGDGSDDPAGPGDPGDGGNDDGVVVVNLIASPPRFSQADITISAGTTVRWVNQASVGHTVTPDGHSEWSEWVTSTSGESYEHTFDTTGEFPYYCAPHRGAGMTGIIRVQ